MQEKIVIQDLAIIAVSDVPPVGEASLALNNLMTAAERADMLERLEQAIDILMIEAENAHSNFSLDNTLLNRVTRLSTPEFFFYTREPMTLQEFESLQNQIDIAAQRVSKGVQLILGTFAVKSQDHKVMNVLTHITCGASPDFKYILKNRASIQDVAYEEYRQNLHSLVKLELFDLDTYNQYLDMPSIKIANKEHTFSFENLVFCTAPNGEPFITGIDICLDHVYATAQNNMYKLCEKQPEFNQPISHVVISNSVSLNPSAYLTDFVLHIDPNYTRHGYDAKHKVYQQYNSYLTPFPFGINSTTGSSLYRLLKLTCSKYTLPTLNDNTHDTLSLLTNIPNATIEETKPIPIPRLEENLVIPPTPMGSYDKQNDVNSLMQLPSLSATKSVRFFMMGQELAKHQDTFAFRPGRPR